MNCGDMVIVKSEDGVSAGGFRIDSCLLGGQFSRQKGGSNGEEGDSSDYAVPAGLALVADKPNVPQALKTALAKPGAMSMLDEDTFNALMEAVDPGHKETGSSKAGGKKKASRKNDKGASGRRTRRRNRK